MDEWKPSFAKKKPFQIILGTVCWNLCPYGELLPLQVLKSELPRW